MNSAVSSKLVEAPLGSRISRTLDSNELFCVWVGDVCVVKLSRVKAFPRDAYAVYICIFIMN